VEKSAAQLCGYFRGRKDAAPAAVERHPTPDAVAGRAPVPRPASVAVRTSRELQAKYGLGTGSVAVVLDCSGSMGRDPAVPGSRGRYQECLDVFERVLGRLPPGVTLSVWTFGQNTGATGPQLPENSINPPSRRWSGLAPGAAHSCRQAPDRGAPGR
jgi:hypothetical protein